MSGARVNVGGHVLTCAQADVFSALFRAAAIGAPCPTNDALRIAAGLASVSGPAAAVKVLAAVGLIRVEWFGRSGRRVTIVATGQSTALPASAARPGRSAGGPKKNVPAAPAGPTGAELVARVEAAAAAAGQSLSQFARPLGGSGILPGLRKAAKPTSATIARIEALIAGEFVQPPARKGNSPSAASPEAATLQSLGTNRIDRDPCPRCGVRRDLGCRHSARAISMGAF